MKKIDKKIIPEMHRHCINCSNYQAHIHNIAMHVPPNTLLDFNQILPNCIWYIEHILNGDSTDSIECPWFDDITSPPTPFQ